MNTIAAELIKLKRSQSLTVVILLPILIVGVGTFNTVLSGEQVQNGWHTLWLRTVVFHGLFPLALGVALLASLIWKPEHDRGNWNLLMSGRAPSLRIVVAKTSVVALLTAAMQVLMVATVLVVGTLLFELDGPLPTPLWIAAGLSIFAAVPLAAVQSALSMLLGSFAVPIALALVGAGMSAFLLTADVGAAIFVLPHALVSRATQLATGTFGDGGSLTAASTLSVVGATISLSAVAIVGSSRILDRRDGRGPCSA
jgi:hypothetical protein